MDKHTFVNRFRFNNLQSSSHRFVYPSKVKAAAVLVPVVENHNQLSVLLTKRASHLKHHASQISFPGGKVEEQDASPIATALREAEEEIGLAEDKVDIIGQLHPYHTISGYVVTPIVAMVKPPLMLTADANEVAEIFQIPLSHFLDDKNHIHITSYYKGKTHPVTFMPFQQYNVWGATAAILADLARHVK